MKEATLVMSGGGAKSAFQAGAEHELRTALSYKWREIFGVSAGGLNAAMIGQERYDELRDIWMRIRNHDVYKKYSWFGMFWRLVIQKKMGVYNNNALWRMIDAYVDQSRFTTKVNIGYVDIISAEFIQSTNTDLDFKKHVYASANIPVIFPPVDGRLVDGGLRNVTPLGDAMDSGAKNIVVILASPLEQTWNQEVYSFVDVGLRLIDIMMHEIFVNDVKTALNINNLVQQSRGPLLSPSGKQYKYYPITIIQPSVPLGGVLDFQPVLSRWRWNKGVEAVRQLKQNG